jgi:hypothetical protein
MMDESMAFVYVLTTEYGQMKSAQSCGAPLNDARSAPTFDAEYKCVSSSDHFHHRLDFDPLRC